MMMATMGGGGLVWPGLSHCGLGAGGRDGEAYDTKGEDCMLWLGSCRGGSWPAAVNSLCISGALGK